MKRKLSFVVFVVALLLVLGVSVVIAQGLTGGTRAPAAMGTAFTYQVQLKSSGSPVNGTCDFQFGLWNDASAGTQIGTTQTKTAAVANGLFTTPDLDFGAGAFDGEARWLAIAVACPSGSSYTALNPRQPLTPAPYALALPGLYTQQNATSPSIIGGYSGNFVYPTVAGATICGGGKGTFRNEVDASFATIGGGSGNFGSLGIAVIVSQ